VIDSQHGHDLLIEHEQLDNLLEVVLKNKKQMKIIKFEGKSLANGEGINKVLDIIEDKIKQQEKIAIVVSARQNATDELRSYHCCQKNYKPLLESLKPIKEGFDAVDFSTEFDKLDKLLKEQH
jgi:aspartokinase